MSDDQRVSGPDCPQVSVASPGGGPHVGGGPLTYTEGGRAVITAGVPFDDYAKAGGVNWSTLKALSDSPLHYRHALTSPRPPTASMDLGSATHIAVLEPHRWADDVAVWTGGRRAGKVFDAWREESAGRLQLNEGEAAKAQAMGEAVRANPEAAALLSEGMAEVVIQWTDHRTGLACKCRVDWLTIREDRAVLVDLKTARSLDRRAFPSAVAAYAYHGQLAHYKAGVQAVTGLPVDTYIIAVESSEPHDVGVFELDTGIPDGALYVGEQMRRELLNQLAECIRLDHWPGRYSRIEPLVLPGWALIGDEVDDFTFGEEEAA